MYACIAADSEYFTHSTGEIVLVEVFAFRNVVVLLGTSLGLALPLAPSGSLDLGSLGGMLETICNVASEAYRALTC